MEMGCLNLGATARVGPGGNTTCLVWEMYVIGVLLSGEGALCLGTCLKLS